ncbi:MAG: phosphoglucosamine mutase [Eggerthellaceae bacterium]|nr:phosphoglucosamine mutase [Eggerthellaceae bacterium]
MGKYFGTDGFRGEAAVGLTSRHAYEIGRYLGQEAISQADDGTRARIVIGKDTRRSGDMLESALAAGITASGADACLLGVVTTPGVAYITRTDDFAFGIMVSASHNPFYDNGIKVLNAQGEKLDEATTAAIEAYLDGTPVELPWAQRENIGIVTDYREACGRYAEHLESLALASSTSQQPFAGCKVGLDCANGSASELGPLIFRTLGAEVHALSTQPNGLNINVDCGSTHMEQLSAFVRENGLDLGFAYDGDADRCLAVDAQGNVVDGDQIMYLCGVRMKEQGRLANNTVVTTIMSNYGLYKALDAQGIAYEKTAVGDKYVYENMAANGHAIGGEQSGHVIFREFATTGDGILTSLMVMDAVLSSGKTLAQLAAPMTVFPQVLKNVRVHDKATTLADADVQAAVDAAGTALEGDGRVLVRQSGTEPVIRVMAEASSAAVCEQHVDAIIAVMKEKGHVVS